MRTAGACSATAQRTGPCGSSRTGTATHTSPSMNSSASTEWPSSRMRSSSAFQCLALNQRVGACSARTGGLRAAARAGRAADEPGTACRWPSNAAERASRAAVRAAAGMRSRRGPGRSPRRRTAPSGCRSRRRPPPAGAAPQWRTPVAVLPRSTVSAKRIRRGVIGIAAAIAAARQQAAGLELLQHPVHRGLWLATGAHDFGQCLRLAAKTRPVPANSRRRRPGVAATSASFIVAEFRENPS